MPVYVCVSMHGRRGNALCCTLATPIAMASASASPTFDASQLEGSSRKRRKRQVIQLRIGSFNVGVEQSMLDSKRKYKTNLE